MKESDTASGVLIDETALTLDELARACAVERQWVVERVESGLLADGSRYVASWRFTSCDLTRARRMRQFERIFDAEPELAALVADLLEDNEHLKERLRAAGLAVE